jgi:hypothetical protein
MSKEPRTAFASEPPEDQGHGKALNFTQSYDIQKGYDERLYDMSKGEIANPAVPNPHPPAVAPLPANQSTGLCIECAKPVAPGQNLVCRDHVRSS